MARPLMRKDHTGEKYGKLTVRCVDEERTGNGKVYWICDCECGESTSVQSTILSRTKSCGCARNSKEAIKKAEKTRNSYPKDITGLKFGRLLVLRKTNMKSHRKSDNGAYLWECLCDCGNICYYSRYSLISVKGVKSCGCLQSDAAKLSGKKYCEYDLTSYPFGIAYCSNGTHFFFDKEDYDKIKEYCWWYDGRYVCAHTLADDKYTTKIIRLHRLVMDIKDREDINVDHKNLVRYDCRKSNLRKATYSQNGMNKDVSHLSSTGIVGVRQEKSGKYVATININNKTIRIGLFKTKEEAAEARAEAELKYFKEFRFNPNADKIDESLIFN